VKKHQNKRFDKIVSLVNYTITSADKALKYVSLSSNFEAEFAYKLYLSDRENLMNELNSLSLAELVAQNAPGGYSNAVELKGLRLEQPSQIESSQLRQENDKLRKEIAILEGELRRSQQRDFQESRGPTSPFPQMDSQYSSSLPAKSREEGKRQPDTRERELQRISDLLKKICEFAEVYDFLELAEKEGKYRYILASIGSTGY
jgi:hypothetical protein